MPSRLSDHIYCNILYISYKLVAQALDSSTKESNLYARAIFYGQYSNTKNKIDNEDLQLKMNKSTTHAGRLDEYTCNDKYPCNKEVWHLAELASNILLLPARFWMHTIDNNLLYYWFTRIIHLPSQYEQQCYAFNQTT